MTRGAVEEKVASNIGVQGSNPDRDCPVCEIFRMAKTHDYYVKIPMETDQNDEKNVRDLIGFGEVKATKTDDFLCLNPKNFSTRDTTLINSMFVRLDALSSAIGNFLVSLNDCSTKLDTISRESTSASKNRKCFNWSASKCWATLETIVLK